MYVAGGVGGANAPDDSRRSELMVRGTSLLISRVGCVLLWATLGWGSGCGSEVIELEDTGAGYDVQEPESDVDELDSGDADSSLPDTDLDTGDTSSDVDSDAERSEEHTSE